MAKNINRELRDSSKVVDLNWDSFTYLIKQMYEEDLKGHK